MILSGEEIRRRRIAGDIVIDPWEPGQLNPNSYNVRLGNAYMIYNRTDPNQKTIYEDPTPDIVREYETFDTKEEMFIPAGTCLLASTMEYTETRNLVPMLVGRSSIGRQFAAIHVTAGLGDVGFCGKWTLEIVAFQNLTLWPGMQIGQLFYHAIAGPILSTYNGRYQGAQGVEALKGGGV